MRYDAVIFDLFGTLVPSFPEPWFEESLTAMALAVDVEPHLFISLWTGETAYGRATGRFATIEANVRHICEAAGKTPTDGQLALANAQRLSFSRQALQPRPDAVGTLQRLKARGLGLALISDCSADVPELWPETPMAAEIPVTIFSCVVGAKKPDPLLYGLACEGLGVPPDRCLYVADGYSHELTGAQQVGMTAVVIAPPDEAPVVTPDYEGAAWTGLRIKSLSELVELIG